MKPLLQDVSTLFFDGAGTLFEVRGTVGEIYGRLAEKYGVKVSSEVLEEAFRKVFQAAPPLAFPQTPAMWIVTQEKKWWYRVVASVFEGIPFAEFDRFFEELYGLFRGSLGWKLFPEVKGVLSTLREGGFRLGIISNFDSRLYEVCEALGIRHFFESLTLSSEAGAAKPDPEIFYKALAKHDLKPEEAVHIGDSPREDLEGARSAGLWSVLVDRSRTESCTSPSIIVPDLKGLLSHL